MKSFLEVFCVIFLVFLVFSIGLFKPQLNWDMIMYIGSAIKLLGFEGVELRDLTYLDLSEYVSEETFSFMTSSNYYTSTVYKDPIAFSQQLPFYEIRYVYSGLIALVGSIIGSFSKATIFISASASSTIVVLSYVLTRRFHSVTFRLLFLLTITFFGLIALSRLSTPDALAVLGVISLFLTLARGKLKLTLLLIVLLPWLRTDYILLSVFTSIYLFLINKRNHAFLSTLFSVLGYILINQISMNYGHFAIFNFSLISGPQPYVESLIISTNFSDYLKAYLQGFNALTHSTAVVSGVLAFFLWATQRLKTFSKESEVASLFLLLSASFFIFHFALFPAGIDRRYYILLWSAVYYIFTFFDLEKTYPLKKVK
jgi:hypothetical protein